jgi:hypothetical protein
MGNSYRLVICASKRIHWWFIFSDPKMKFRPGGHQGRKSKFYFWVWISIWTISGTYLKHKSPIDMNFPILVLPLLAGDLGKIKIWIGIGHNSGPGCRIDLKLVPKYYVLQDFITSRGFSFKILKLGPLGPTLKKSLNFYITYKKLEVNIGPYTKFQVSKFIGSKFKVGGGTLWMYCIGSAF